MVKNRPSHRHWSLQFVMITHLAQDTPPNIQELPQQGVLDSELNGGSTTIPAKSRTRPIQFFNLRRFGAGILDDIRARAPWYLSDWTDAWNYRVVPATALTFFSKWVSMFSPKYLLSEVGMCLSVLPGIAFSLDLIETTEQYGVMEVLLASFMAAFIFSVFGAQPLTIVGVTGIFEFKKL